MKRLEYCIALILIILSLSIAAQDNTIYKIRRKTPELGSKLSPMCKVIVKKANPVLETNPDPLFLRFNKTMSLFSKSAYKTIDTATNISGVPLRIYFPKKSKKDDSIPVLILFHGGAFIFGSIETYHLLANKLCIKTGCIVVVPDYRLAPEYPYPAALNDCYETLLWVNENIDSFGGDKNSIGLIGDSAGGNLVAASILKSYNEDGPKINLMVLYYPNTTMVDTVYASRKYFMGSCGPHYMLSETLLRKVKKQYLTETNVAHPYVSPLLTSSANNFPPTLLITAQCDPLRDEGELFGKKLEEAGVAVTTIQYKSMIHGFISFYPILSKGKKALRKTSKYTNNIFLKN